MGGPAPDGEAGKETEQKYKVEVLKMEMVPATATPAPRSVLASKKALMIIAPENFHDEEFSTPRELMELKGVKVTVASTTPEAGGMYGARVNPDIALQEANAADYDAIIFVGGNGASVYYDNPDALGLAVEAQKNNKVLGAICIAPVILAKAGVLEGKKATVSPFSVGALKAGGAVYTGESVQVTDKIVTAKGPDATEEFGIAILKLLQQE